MSYFVVHEDLALLLALGFLDARRCNHVEFGYAKLFISVAFRLSLRRGWSRLFLLLLGSFGNRRSVLVL